MGKQGGAPGMGKRGHLPPLEMLYSVLYIAKRSVDELFVHYFHNLSSASGGFAPRSHWGFIPGPPLEDFRPQTPNLPTPGKIPAGAHGQCSSGHWMRQKYTKNIFVYCETSCHQCTLDTDELLVC